jgi:hypothetical protein
VMMEDVRMGDVVVTGQMKVHTSYIKLNYI